MILRQKKLGMKNKLVIGLLFLVTNSLGNACNDPTYVNLGEQKVSETSNNEFEDFKRLDELCKLELNAKGIINSNSGKTTTDRNIEQNHVKYSNENNEYELGEDGFYRKKNPGNPLIWGAIGIGTLIFVGSTVNLSTINDECDPLLVISYLKSAEQCKEEAEDKKNIAKVGMFTGGFITLLGMIGLLASD
jgi:hypothetical protein